MDTDRGWPGKRGDARPQHLGAVGSRLRIGPVVELAVAPARRQAADVRALGVAALKILVGDVAVLVPVLLLGDAEVDEGLVPDVGEAHCGRNVTPGTGPSPRGSGWPPPRRRPDSPGSCPWRARASRAPARVRAGGGSTGATSPAPRPPAASSSGPGWHSKARGSRAGHPARCRTSTPRRRG